VFILRIRILAQFALFSLCAVAPLTATAQISGALPPVAEATLDFLPDQHDRVALKCDALADHPDDPHRIGDGVAFERIGVVDALTVCEQAANRPPARPRYQFLYGRVLEAAQRYDEAARQFSMPMERRSRKTSTGPRAFTFVLETPVWPPPSPN
jgi:hypothetical protein